MPIPDYQTLMLPLLKSFADSAEKTLHQVSPQLAKEFTLGTNELEAMLPSGAQTVFYNRIGWARTYLKKAGLLDIPKRGYCKITPAGLAVLAKQPQRVDIKFLEQFEDFLTFRESRKVETNPQSKPDTAQPSLLEQTPEESLETAHQTLRLKLTDDLLSEIKQRSPEFFENLVVKLMLAIGYGGSRQEAGKAVGRSGDGGIDGIISEDRLGLDAIYLQAKRWEGVVGRPEIMKFVGALAGQRANKGVFITTSHFTKEALEYASSSNYKVVLIDGERLAELMIEYNLGVSVSVVYELKKIDTDFFSEE